MILRSPTDYENGGFPFVARMEQSVIRVSSFTQAVASPTPHATFLDSASLIQATILKPILTPRIFKRGTKGSDIYILKLRAFVVSPLFLCPLWLHVLFPRRTTSQYAMRAFLTCSLRIQPCLKKNSER